MKRQIPVLLALLSILVWATAAQAEDNLLQDPSFETGTSSEAFDPAWSKFGNVYHELVTPRMSHWTAKLFGSFTGQVNYSGISQEFDDGGPTSASQDEPFKDGSRNIGASREPARAL